MIREGRELFFFFETFFAFIHYLWDRHQVITSFFQVCVYVCKSKRLCFRIELCRKQFLLRCEWKCVSTCWDVCRMGVSGRPCW